MSCTHNNPDARGRCKTCRATWQRAYHARKKQRHPLAKCACSRPGAVMYRGEPVCATCLALDGTGTGIKLGDPSARFEVTQALRSVGGVAGMEALQLETGMQKSALEKVLLRMRRDGRAISRIEDDGFGDNHAALWVLVSPREAA